MANDLTVPDPFAYAGREPSAVVGLQEFADHDPTQAWDDGGAAHGLVADLGEAVKRYGADQVKIAILEYLAKATAHLTAIHRELCFAVDASNNAVQFAPVWQLRPMALEAAKQARKDGDAAMHDALSRCAVDLAQALIQDVQQGPALAELLMEVLGNAGYTFRDVTPARAEPADERPVRRQGSLVAPKQPVRAPAGRAPGKAAPARPVQAAPSRQLGRVGNRLAQGRPPAPEGEGEA
jgi:hypothetical protein